MSEIRIKKLKVANYRSFKDEIVFEFPYQDYLKPISIIGYNNSGKTNLMNSILYSTGYKYTTKDTFTINDFYNRNIDNVPNIGILLESSIENKFDGKQANLNGFQILEIKIDGIEIEGAKFKSLDSTGQYENWQAFGALKYFNVFYINFHNIKEEIKTKKTSWGNLSSFLAKHIQKLVETDPTLVDKKDTFQEETKQTTEKVLQDSLLQNFITKIKENYSNNLRNNDCYVEFGLPQYEDIFLQMLFKVGLNGSTENLIPIEQFGDGFISMFVMAVIQAIAETNINDKCIFLFEEPESFLHENHQEYFYKMVLCPLANKGHQVIYTTHSDKMIDIFDTKSIIRLEFDELEKRTVCKYNNTTTEPVYENVIQIQDFNNFIKSIEPNLNKILFSRKVMLVEGPNDLLCYNYAIEKIIYDLTGDLNFSKAYLNFRNISILPHHGKATALYLLKLCKHFGLEYFLINDLDFEVNNITELNTFESLEELHQSNLYQNDGATERSPNSKGMITTNFNLIKNAGLGKIHFNIPKLESVIGYENNDKDSLKIWSLLKQIDAFEENFFPKNLSTFIEIDSIEELVTQ
jgi:putative ATP-dependent endonuclease of OLD family